MKKQKKIFFTIMIIVAVLLGLIPSGHAIYVIDETNFSVLLTANKTQVNKGETLDVTISLGNFKNIGEGLNSFMGDLEYDKTKLSIEASQIVAQNGWDAPTYENDKLLTLKGSMITAKEAIMKMTFTVKSDAELGTTTIRVKNAEAANTENDFTGTQGAIEIQIVETNGENPQGKTLSNIKITKAPTKTEYKVGEKFDKKGMVVTAEYSDGTTKEVTDYTYSPDGKLAQLTTKITVTYTEGEVTKTAEQSIKVTSSATSGKNEEKTDGDLPKTGISNYYMVIAIITIIGAVSYISYRKYKNV